MDLQAIFDVLMAWRYFACGVAPSVPGRADCKCNIDSLSPRVAGMPPLNVLVAWYVRGPEYGINNVWNGGIDVKGLSEQVQDELRRLTSDGKCAVNASRSDLENSCFWSSCSQCLKKCGLRVRREKRSTRGETVERGQDESPHS